MILKPVLLQKTETCLSYALRRIGAQHLLPIDYAGMVSGRHFDILGPDEPLIGGDLVLWDHNLQRCLMPNEITDNGRIVHGYMCRPACITRSTRGMAS